MSRRMTELRGAARDTREPRSRPNLLEKEARSYERPARGNRSVDCVPFRGCCRNLKRRYMLGDGKTSPTASCGCGRLTRVSATGSERCIYSDHAADLGFAPSARHGQAPLAHDLTGSTSGSAARLAI